MIFTFFTRFTNPPQPAVPVRPFSDTFGKIYTIIDKQCCVVSFGAYSSIKQHIAIPVRNSRDIARAAILDYVDEMNRRL